jgi:uncharacterized protein (TIGR00251 family)
MACTLSVHLKPGARVERIAVSPVRGVDIAVHAPPVEGKANEALVKLLAGVLDLPKSSIAITRGFTGRNKTVRIDGMTEAEVLTRLKERTAGAAR